MNIFGYCEIYWETTNLPYSWEGERRSGKVVKSAWSAKRWARNFCNKYPMGMATIYEIPPTSQKRKQESH